MGLALSFLFGFLLCLVLKVWSPSMWIRTTLRTTIQIPERLVLPPLYLLRPNQCVSGWSRYSPSHWEPAGTTWEPGQAATSRLACSLIGLLVCVKTGLLREKKKKKRPGCSSTPTTRKPLIRPMANL